MRLLKFVGTVLCCLAMVVGTGMGSVTFGLLSCLPDKFVKAFLKRLLGARNDVAVGDRVMVVSRLQDVPIGSICVVEDEAINHTTQRPEFRVQMGDTSRWIQAEAFTKVVAN